MKYILLELKVPWPISAISETNDHAHNLKQMFLSQQVKRNEIITNENGEYELTDELPKDLRLKKISWNYSLLSSLLPKMKTLPILAKNY